MTETQLMERKKRTPVAELEFIGCYPVRLSATEIESPEWEGRRIEYWHAATETAWLAQEPATLYHEVPSRRLPALVERICLVRGSAARCLGSSDLRIREPDGSLGDLMQADEAVYLHPTRSRMPQGVAFFVGEDDPPDVVLEVDNTTDVRRGKLIAYGEWGFPEIWVETPDEGSPSRPRSLRPRLTIYLLDDGRYREAFESRAFPGWRTEEIHRALNEPELSPATDQALWRVGRALGKREGTHPEDDQLGRRLERRGRARGLADGRARGALEERAAMAGAILRHRGVEVPPDFPADLSADDRAVLDAASSDDLVAAGSRATSLADFLARLREQPVVKPA